jgi:hypothetical protein
MNDLLSQKLFSDTSSTWKKRFQRDLYYTRMYVIGSNISIILLLLLSVYLSQFV